MNKAWIVMAVLATLAMPAQAASLPQTHDYQKALRAYLSTLTEKDFEITIKPCSITNYFQKASDEDLYKLWLQSQATYRSVIPDLAKPASQFTLKAIEGGTNVALPQAQIEALPLARLASWNLPVNPYFKSEALKKRAFVLIAVDLMMLDELHEQPVTGKSPSRSDFLGGNLIWWGYAYRVIRPDLPVEARKAFDAGLKKMVLRLNGWGPKGAMTDMDLFASVGLKFSADALGDAEVFQIAKSYTHRLYSDPHYFNAAGYFVDNDCFDTSYNGISLYFAAWAALVTDMGVVREAVDKAGDLRAHLTLPEPTGVCWGPSHCSSRTSADPANDQWEFFERMVGQAMLTDHQMYAMPPLPGAKVMRQAAESLVANLNTPVKAVPADMVSWGEVHWISCNFTEECYVKGFYQKRATLEKNKSELLLPPFKRPGGFIRAFENAFLVAKYDDYGIVIHTGPVGAGHAAWKRPYGFGGGTLSAFWTPSAGSLLLGRRRGIQGAVYDTVEEWRQQPVHAVSGLTAEGKTITSARIRRPEVEIAVQEPVAEVRVSGDFPAEDIAQGKLLNGRIHYERTFKAAPEGLTVETRLSSDGTDVLTELYEAFPAFLGSGDYPGHGINSKITLLAGGKWTEATDAYTADVTALKIAKYQGAMTITLDKPHRVKLSPGDWMDGFQSQAACRNVLIDLLESDKPTPCPASVSLSYTLKPEKKADKPAGP